MTYIRKGYGFHVGQDFARTKSDTPITLEPKEYARPGFVIGLIAGDPSSPLGFLRHATVRVEVPKSAIGESQVTL